MTPKVRYAELLPSEFLARLRERPVGYLPLGTLEFHGEHCALGSDSVISAGLFERAARELGGIVFPPLFLGPDRTQLQPDGKTLQGMDTASSTVPHRQLDGSCYWVGRGLFVHWCEAILAQAARAGFKVIVADGHGPSRHAWGDHVDGWEQQFGLLLVSVDRDLKDGWRSQMDHAAKNETSLMLALAPDLVDMERVPADGAKLPQGTGGVHPHEASAEYGEECLAASIAALKAKLDELGV